MKIGVIRHKGLRRFYEADATGGVPAAIVEKLRNMLTFLAEIESEDELRTVPSWRAHQLSGARKGTWALHATRNWRLTFRIGDDEITELDLEDYH